MEAEVAALKISSLKKLNRGSKIVILDSYAFHQPASFPLYASSSVMNQTRNVRETQPNHCYVTTDVLDVLYPSTNFRGGVGPNYTLGTFEQRESESSSTDADVLVLKTHSWALSLVSGHDGSVSMSCKMDLLNIGCIDCKVLIKMPYDLRIN